MADPTGARMRTMNSFFDSPRFPIKELPDRKPDDDDDEDGAEDHVTLPGWNAYIGPLR